jgi:hypothetical protein
VPRSEPLAILIFTAALLTPAPPSSAAICAGDCDSDGEVSINELVTVVNIALGGAPLEQCFTADTNHDGAAAVNEVIGAVNLALSSCAACDPASAALSVARALVQLPRLSGVVAVGLDGLTSTPECDLGGSVQTTCEDSGAGTRHNEVDAAHCRLTTTEGPLELNGHSSVTAAGQCPDILIPANIQFMFGGHAVLQSDDGTPLVDTELATSIRLLRLITGMRPCTIKGGEAIVDERVVVHAVPAGRTGQLDFDQLNLLTEFVDFVGQCDLTQLRTTANGRLTLSDDYGDRPFSLAATLHDMVVGIDLPNRAVRFDGEVESSCFGGSVRLRTLEPLDYRPEQACFTTGTLALGLPAGTVQVTLIPGGGVETATAGGGAMSYDSCLSLPR